MTHCPHRFRRSVAALGAGLCSLAGQTLADPVFTDVTVAAGVDYVQYAPNPLPTSEPEYMTGSAAAGDYDGDGWTDLYVTRLDASDILFRNRGDGTFEDVTVGAGLGALLPSNGAAWGDIDNDGDLDLYVTTLGPGATRFHLFINDGAGGFIEDALARGAALAGSDDHYGTSVTFGDYDRDGYIDIHTSEWRLDAQNPGLAAANARLLRNLGAANPGFFEDRTVAAGVALDGVPTAFPVAGTFTFASRFADLDGDDWSDLIVSADFGTSRLFWNNKDGTFTDGTAAAGVGGDENGMGNALGDYDGDGRLDWFVTSIYDPLDTCNQPGNGCNWGATGNRLYRNAGQRVFTDATDTAGVRDGAWGWGAAFLDYDNDGDLDLTMTNGIDFPFVPAPFDEIFAPFRTDPMKLWRNDGAAGFTEIAGTSGLSHTGSGKGLLTFDYDRDGDLDIFVVTNSGHPVLYRNDGGNDNSWLQITVAGRQSNEDGLGARITVTEIEGGPSQTREVNAGSHFLGQSEHVAHFGFGPDGPPLYEVRVHWPRTHRSRIQRNVTRNRRIHLPEPAGLSGCGLIGIEVIPLVVALAWTRRPRRERVPTRAANRTHA